MQWNKYKVMTFFGIVGYKNNTTSTFCFTFYNILSHFYNYKREGREEVKG